MGTHLYMLGVCPSMVPRTGGGSFWGPMSSFLSPWVLLLWLHQHLAFFSRHFLLTCSLLSSAAHTFLADTFHPLKGVFSSASAPILTGQVGLPPLPPCVRS